MCCPASSATARQFPLLFVKTIFNDPSGFPGTLALSYPVSSYRYFDRLRSILQNAPLQALKQSRSTIMPPRSSNGGTAASSDAEKIYSNQKFELPALDFQFSSLTEGTDIPPPEPDPAPVQEVPTPPETLKVEANKKAKANGNYQKSPASNADSNTTDANHAHDGSPISPTLSSRGSIRRLISKTLLNNQYANGESDGALSESPSRPESRATTVGGGDRKSRRASGFFRRFRSSDRPQKRGSISGDPEITSVSPTKPKGPPPPMIPELNALQSKIDIGDGGSLGSDLFKDIK